VEATEESVASALDVYPGSEPLAALCFSCAARKLVLGTRVEEECLAFNNNYPRLPFAGFYTYGEFAPLERNRPVRFHNQTFVNLVMGEK
jgi:hypothetical protein